MDKIIDYFSEALRLLSQKLSLWAEMLVLHIPNFLLALVISTAAFFSVKYVKKISLKFCKQLTNNKTILNLATNLSTFIFGIIVLFIILGIFDLSGTINKILATAGVLGLAIGLALQDPMNNLFSGIFMSVEELYKIEDVVETNGFFGTITAIDLRFTRMRLFGGQDVIIPNKNVLQSPLTNYTSSGERRVEISCGVSYSEDLNKVEQVAKKAASSLPGVKDKKQIDLWFSDFGDSSVNFSLRYWIDTPENSFLKLRSEGLQAIFKAFNENNINIPFPIRTLDIDTKSEKE